MDTLSQLGSAASDAATSSLEAGLSTVMCLNWAAPLQTLQPPKHNPPAHIVLSRLNWAAPLQTLQLGRVEFRGPGMGRSQLGSAASDAATTPSPSRPLRTPAVSIGQRRFRRCNSVPGGFIASIGESQLGSAASDAATRPPLNLSSNSSLSQLGSAASDAATSGLWLGCKRGGASQLGSAASDAATVYCRCTGSPSECLNWAAPLQTLQPPKHNPPAHIVLSRLNWAAPLQTLQLSHIKSVISRLQVSIGQRRFRRCNHASGCSSALRGLVSIGQRRFRRCNFDDNNLESRDWIVSIGQRRFRRCNGSPGD